MHYKFYAHGHQNISATHKTTLEFTKDNEISTKGDCIIGVNADFDSTKLGQLIKKIKNKNITIAIQTISKNKKYKKIKETIFAEINPKFDDDREFVIRKTDFISERTFAINSNKAAFGLNRDLINYLKEKGNRIIVVIGNKQK